MRSTSQGIVVGLNLEFNLMDVTSTRAEAMLQLNQCAGIAAAGLFIDWWTFKGGRNRSDNEWLSLFKEKKEIGLSPEQWIEFINDYSLNRGLPVDHKLLNGPFLAATGCTNPSPDVLAKQWQKNEKDSCRLSLASKCLFLARPDQPIAMYDGNAKNALHKIYKVSRYSLRDYTRFHCLFSHFIQDHRIDLLRIIDQVSKTCPLSIKGSTDQFFLRRLADKYLWVIGRPERR